MKSKRLYILTAMLLVLTSITQAQVGIGTSTPSSSAQLEVNSSTKGFLPPRVALIATNSTSPISSPVEGLLVYNTATAGSTPNTVTPGFYYYNGSAWVRLIVPTDNAANVTGTVAVANGGTGVTTSTGTGSVVLSSSPVLISPTLGVATATSINKVVLTSPSSSATLTIANGKTLTANNSIILAGTDGTTMTFPSTSANVARADAAQTFTGTQTFTNSLVINGTGGTGTGLKLPAGASSGNILTSDVNGNASWQPGAVVIYTEVHTFNNNSTEYSSNVDFNDFGTIMADNVVTLYGSSYGFLESTVAGTGTGKDRWVAPRNGRYRITTNAYFNPSAYTNPRLYAYKNNTDVCNITSAIGTSTTGQDIATSTSAIIQMNQGDYINWKVMGSGAKIWRGTYHTFFRVESVD